VVSAVLERIDRAAKLLGAELSELRGAQITNLTLALDQIAAAVTGLRLSDADGLAIASLMSKLVDDPIERSSLFVRSLRTQAYFACLRELRAKVRRLNGRQLGVVQRSGAWSRVLHVAWRTLSHRFYFSWFAAAGIAYLAGLSPSIDRPIAGLLRISIKPA
jgi:hypothetical protein